MLLRQWTQLSYNKIHDLSYISCLCAEVEDYEVLVYLGPYKLCYGIEAMRLLSVTQSVFSGSYEQR